MKDTTTSIIIMGIVITAGVSLFLSTQGYFDVFSPEPKIALRQVTMNPNENRCEVEFNLVNSGDIDGFAVVELRTGPSKNLIEQNRYFVRANTIEELKITTTDIPAVYCNELQNTIKITRTETE